MVPMQLLSCKVSKSLFASKSKSLEVFLFTVPREVMFSPMSIGVFVGWLACVFGQQDI